MDRPPINPIIFVFYQTTLSEYERPTSAPENERKSVARRQRTTDILDIIAIGRAEEAPIHSLPRLHSDPRIGEQLEA